MASEPAPPPPAKGVSPKALGIRIGLLFASWLVSSSRPPVPSRPSSFLDPIRLAPASYGVRRPRSSSPADLRSTD